MTYNLGLLLLFLLFRFQQRSASVSVAIFIVYPLCCKPSGETVQLVQQQYYNESDDYQK